MQSNAFTEGVKLGGLTTSTEIRLLLCYLIRTAAPLNRTMIEDALLSEQLVNYFELVANLVEAEKKELVTLDEDGFYHITSQGRTVTDELSMDLLPRSIRETATRAAIKARRWAHKSAQHKAEIKRLENGFLVDCAIQEQGEKIFGMQFSVPDALTAQTVQTSFVNNGDRLYGVVLETLLQKEEA